MEKDLIPRAVEQLRIRYASAAPRIARRTTELKKNAKGAPAAEIETAAGIDVLREMAATYGVDPYAFAVRLAVDDVAEREQLIAAYRDSMADEMPVADIEVSNAEPPPGPVDADCDDAMPPRDTSYDEPDYSKPPKARPKPGQDPLGATSVRRNEYVPLDPFRA
ncbi:hypothetical protein [Chitinasiproducens palmae]|uniref:Uncharacterized protein n=1 Tax=Chitinasiproducens palmae TaxID=1770053 RepID=A0A1H2PSB7_9BURK|nr:hypothetical protein [Chitinasiproducens palmae]SDV49845.1 hypothetical protein SAMN05216551_109187 [Chitinasiproducens palmae]